MRRNILKITKDDFILLMIFKIILYIQLAFSALAILVSLPQTGFALAPVVAKGLAQSASPIVILFLTYFIFIPAKIIFTKTKKAPPIQITLLGLLVLYFLVTSTTYAFQRIANNEINIITAHSLIISVYLYALLYGLCKQRKWARIMSAPVCLSPFLVVFYAVVISGVSIGKISFSHIYFLFLIFLGFWLTYHLFKSKIIKNYFTNEFRNT